MQYLTGFGIGFGIFSVGVLIMLITRQINFNGFNSEFSLGIVCLYLLGYLFQGMSEEVALRGYLMVSLANKKSVVFAIIANSIIFAILHGLNPGISVFAIINLVLFGIFASLYFIKTNNIWGISALHSAWNFFQGNFYGFRVSGTDSGASVFSITCNEGGKLINGGDFGPEGGLAITLVLVAGIVILYFMKGKGISEDKKANEEKVEVAVS